MPFAFSSLRRQALLTVALLGAQTFCAAQAQTAAADSNFPSQSIKILVGFAPGGSSDTVARIMVPKLTELFKQNVVIDNKPGAGGNIGGAETARSAPDGYTIFMTTSGISAINPFLYAKMPYDPMKDLMPVSALVSLNNVLVVHPSVKANSVQELISLAKAQPGAVTYASSGSGTSIHMSAEMLKHLAGINMTHIPYKGSAPALTDLMGGQVMIMLDNIPSALPHIKSGKLRALATTGAKRDPLLPDLPTIAEAGVAGYESGVWFGLAVPAGTPREIIAKLNAEAVKGTKSPDFVKRMTELGYNIIGSSPEQMGDMLRTEVNRWGPIVKASGAKAD